mmetsp:Transcript_123505/g.394524  ORF Transcript_123505/g.394524 Transcript_123505/m.394524 type:complete len:111 (+) Transcript_123505:265-597(+)
MESALATGEKCGVDKICLVFDLSGFGYKSMDNEVTNRLFQLLADFFPERLGRLLLWNAPRMFSAFWRIVSQVIDPVTFRKIQFVHGAGLLDFVAHDSLPEEVASRLGFAV